MRTNIDIDDKLMARAMRITGAKTKKAAVEEALERIVAIDGQKGMLKLRGKIHWEGHDPEPGIEQLPNEAWGR